MFLGWFDPDGRRPAAEKLNEAIARYRARFGGDPPLCLCHEEAANALVGAFVDCEIEIRPVSFVSPHTFYVGTEEA